MNRQNDGGNPVFMLNGDYHLLNQLCLDYISGEFQTKIPPNIEFNFSAENDMKEALTYFAERPDEQDVEEDEDEQARFTQEIAGLDENIDDEELRELREFEKQYCEEYGIKDGEEFHFYQPGVTLPEKPEEMFVLPHDFRKQPRNPAILSGSRKKRKLPAAIHELVEETFDFEEKNVLVDDKWQFSFAFFNELGQKFTLHTHAYPPVYSLDFTFEFEYDDYHSNFQYIYEFELGFQRENLRKACENMKFLIALYQKEVIKKFNCAIGIK